MREKGKHRRIRKSGLARGFAAAGTGGAAIVIPLLASSGAQAAALPHVPVAAPALAASTGTVRAAVPVSAHQSGAAKATEATYTVKLGDSLTEIAGRHHVKGGWQRLYEENRSVIGGDPSLIHPGMKIKLDGAEGKAGGTGRAKTNERAARSSERAPSHTSNLDGWIREALDIMRREGIPGSYHGIHRNVMRESSGNPHAVNNWDSNARKGTPSKGLLQVIDPTFRAYHVPGTKFDPHDPVANITAAANYAAHRYGSIDNVNGPY
ncbi:transglycosylase SLT domain-containing protein [Streptomyces sp. NPDC090021]|uniref:transglycosylase SLT domain-containing protein n=1 Tax=Streptomyces sp. NPDC090021 TaxID=3365919 RepID=UPI0037F7AF12